MCSRVFSFVIRLCAAVCGIAAVSLTADADIRASEPQSEVVDFNRDIRPILTNHCTACHGGVKQAADVSFVYADAAMDCIEPGDPENSYLLERILDTDDETRMPPQAHGRRLNDQEIGLITRWIEQGAKWGKHWAYETPRRLSPPTVSDQDWGRQPLDSFVLQKLDGLGVRPAKAERPERWLRRVTLDLTGLPPTLEQRREFLAELENSNAANDSAYTHVVDRLLASSAFGERWASVWFDLVRYADSRGYGEDSPRNIWKYRDWVIDALNHDMPYDEFTIKQIAGDLVPGRTIEDHIATAVHRLTHTNEEGGTDDEEFRVVSIIDRVNTTWQTWQGVTFGCVQCHDHPYDPFRHDEYYKFAAFFNNTADCDLSDDWPLIDVPLDPAEYRRASRLDTEINRLKVEHWRARQQIVSRSESWIPLRIGKASTSNATKLAIESKKDWDEYYAVGTITSGPTITVELPLPANLSQLTGIRITALPLEPEKALADSEVGFVMSGIEARLVSPASSDGDSAAPTHTELEFASVIGDEPFPIYDPEDSLKDGKEGFAAFSRIHHDRKVVLPLKRSIDVQKNSKLVVRIRCQVFDLAAFTMAVRRAHFAVSSDLSLIRLADDESIIAKETQLRQLTDVRRQIESTRLPVLNERPKHLRRPTHVFARGAYLTKAEEVASDIPQLLNQSETPVSDRHQMANWLVSAENPLTARVAVNRFWARMFGVGIVATEEDFGSTGERPSHPKLLDDLSVRFREDYRWSVKRLLREIALSSTYRQSSEMRPETQADDPDNRWLARGPRHTLPAETIRDQMLAIGGLLSPDMHGESVFPPIPGGVWTARRGTWITPKQGHPDRYRRGVYTHVKRSVPFPTHETFDAPSRDFCFPKRLRSNTPLQPLMLLNDRAFIECADALGDIMLEHSDDLSEQIEHGFLRAACREPSREEMKRLTQLYREIETESNAKIAMQSTASVLLNLDEVITK